MFLGLWCVKIIKNNNYSITITTQLCCIEIFIKTKKRKFPKNNFELTSWNKIFKANQYVPLENTTAIKQALFKEADEIIQMYVLVVFKFYRWFLSLLMVKRAGVPASFSPGCLRRKAAALNFAKKLDQPTSPPLLSSGF